MRLGYNFLLFHQGLFNFLEGLFYERAVKTNLFHNRLEAVCLIDLLDELSVGLACERLVLLCHRVNVERSDGRRSVAYVINGRVGC